MNVLQWIDEVRRRVPEGALVGTRWKATTTVTLPSARHQVAAAARIDPQGRRREQFWCDGLRVAHAALLRLTCAEQECPHAAAVRAQWVAFHRLGAATDGD